MSSSSVTIWHKEPIKLLDFKIYKAVVWLVTHMQMDIYLTNQKAG